jgi:small-conductance mechanosensitive channel/CRP-like cAMP-binding protein
MKQLIAGLLEYADMVIMFVMVFALASFVHYKLKVFRASPVTKMQRVLAGFSHVAFSFLIFIASIAGLYYRDCGNYPAYNAWIILWGSLTLLGIVDLLIVEISIALTGKCQIPKVLRNLFQGAILLIIFCLVVKFIFGQDISVLLTSSAILTGILGFSMQGLLSNLIAGAVIHSSGRFNIGDWVYIGDVNGVITQINWSDTWITTWTGNRISVPNASVLSSNVINASAPTKSARLDLPFSASYNDAPHEVRQCLLEAAAESPHILPNPPPCVFLTTYADFAINYELRVWLKDFSDSPRVRGEINEAVWYKFKRKGIEIPFPMSGKLLDNVLTAAARINQAAPEPNEESDAILVDLFKSDFVKRLIPETVVPQEQLPELFKTVASEFKRVTFATGEHIFRQGVKDDESLYIFIDGKLQGEVHQSDQKTATFEPQKGCLLGEMSFLTGSTRSATIKVMETSHFLKVSPATMRKLVHAIPPLMDAISQLAVERTQQIEASLSKTLTQEKTEQIRKSIFRRFWNVLVREE